MKKILIITIFIILLLGIWQVSYAQQKLIADYPSIEGQQPYIGMSLPALIKYIYMFALGIVGFVALLAMIIGAAMYVFSAGNPSKASDAKDRIMSALLGVLLLLASVLILRTISPDLVNFNLKLPHISSGGNGGGNNIPTEARTCFCGGAFERCYINGQTCLEQCDGYCKMMHNTWTVGLCNINTTNCP